VLKENQRLGACFIPAFRRLATGYLVVRHTGYISQLFYGLYEHSSQSWLLGEAPARYIQRTQQDCKEMDPGNLLYQTSSVLCVVPGQQALRLEQSIVATSSS
jgi:hypothetical protein